MDLDFACNNSAALSATKHWPIYNTTSMYIYERTRTHDAL